MPLSKYEQELLKRAQAAGLPVNAPLAGDTFRFLLFPVVTAGVDYGAFEDLVDQANERSLAEEMRFEEIKRIVLIPIICDPAVHSQASFVRVKRKESAIHLGRNFDPNRWKSLKPAARRRLAAAEFAEAIGSLAEDRLPNQTAIVISGLLTGKSPN
jgi:hypothetical protein